MLIFLIFYQLIFISPLHCETQAPWENMFFSVSIIKLKMFGGENVYISVVGAFAEAKTQIISICTLFFDFSN